MKKSIFRLMLLLALTMASFKAFSKVYPIVSGFPNVAVNANASIYDPRPDGVFDYIKSNSPNIVTIGGKNYKSWTDTHDSTWYDANVKNRLVFYIKPEENCANKPFTATVTVELKVYNYWNNVDYEITTINKTLTIKYDPKNVFTKRVVYEFEGGYDLKAKITGLSMSNVAYSSALALDLEYEVESYVEFNPAIAYPVDLGHSSKEFYESEYRVFWNRMNWAESYDLEWTVVDYYSEFVNPAAIASSEIPEDIFKFNSSRINTTNNEFFIPAMYSKGILIYRIRGVGKSVADGFEKDVVSRWSTEINQPESLSAYKYIVLDGLEPKLNWQFSTVYAEEGKNKVAIKYYDGTLRERQAVTKMNTGINMVDPDEPGIYNNKVNNSVVSETIYDHQGRAAINVLPVPTDDESLKFYKRFNLNTASTPAPYDRSNFDIDRANPCAIAADPMSNDSGAANYYSSQNVFLTDKAHPATNQMASFIPNAGGYPFVQTLYTPDNTGKIQAKGGAGADFQVGSGKETKYFYGRPFQEELDRLFGGDAGFAEHYQKNVTVDPNGQTSISYLNMQEKVVATSLIGAVPTNVTTLTSRTLSDVEVDLLNKVNANDNSGKADVLDLTNGTRVLSQDFFVADDGVRDFRYKLINNSYTEECLEANICYECVLDLKISVKNACGIEMLGGIDGGTGTKVTIDDKSFLTNTNQTMLNNCSEEPTTKIKGTIATPWKSNLEGTEASMTKGVYSLTKSLAVNQQALDKYTQLYLKNNTCITDKLAEFETEERNKIDTSECQFDCAKWSLQIGTNYQSSSLNPGVTETQWQAIYKDYLDNCANNNVLCMSAYNAMLADVSPSGQYGELYPSGPGIGGTGHLKAVNLDKVQAQVFPLSVFNDYNYLPWKDNINSAYPGGYRTSWRFPLNLSETSADKKFNYLSELGDIEYIYLTQDSAGNYLPAVGEENYEFIEVTSDGKRILPKYLKDAGDFVRYWKSSWAKSLVSYHPEYPFYEECLTRQSSNQFDKKWLETENVTQAGDNFNNIIGKNWLYPAGGTVGGTTYDALDPFIDLLDAGLQTAIRGKLDVFMTVSDGVSTEQLSLEKTALVMANCPDLNLNNCAVASVLNCLEGNTINTTAEWATYRQLYFSLKQKLLESYTTKKAVLGGYYNGCVGIEPFDAFAYWFYNTPYTIPTNGSVLKNTYQALGFYYFANSQFYNPEQTCNWARYWLYKNKIARYPQNRMLYDNEKVKDNNLSYPISGISSSAGVLDNFLNLNDPATTAAIVEEAKRVTDVASYRTSCGQCPVGEAMVQTLNQLITNGNISGTNILLAEGCSSLAPTSETVNGILMERLVGGQLGVGKTLTYSGSSVGNVFTATFTNNNSGSVDVRTITFNLPTGYAIEDITQFCCIKGNMDFSNKNALDFTVTAFAKPKANDQYYNANTAEFMTALMATEMYPLTSITVSASTTEIDLVHCEVAPLCRPSYAANQIKLLLNGLAADGVISVGGASVTRDVDNRIEITSPYQMLFTDELAKALFPAVTFDSYDKFIYRWELLDLSPVATHHKVFNVSVFENTGATDPVFRGACQLGLNMSGQGLNQSIGFNDIRVINSIYPLLGRRGEDNYTSEAIMKAMVEVAPNTLTEIEIRVNSGCLNLGDCTVGLPNDLKSGISVASKIPKPDVGNAQDYINVVSPIVTSGEFIFPPETIPANPCTDGVDLMNTMLQKIVGTNKANMLSEGAGVSNSGLNLGTNPKVTVQTETSANVSVSTICGDCGLKMTEEELFVNGNKVNKSSYTGIRSITKVADNKFKAVVSTSYGRDVTITFELQNCNIPIEEQEKVKWNRGGMPGDGNCAPTNVLGFNNFGTSYRWVPEWDMQENEWILDDPTYFWEGYYNGYNSELDSNCNYRLNPNFSPLLPGEHSIIALPHIYPNGSGGYDTAYHNRKVHYGDNSMTMIYRLSDANNWQKLWERTTQELKKDYAYKFVVWHKPIVFANNTNHPNPEMKLNFYFGNVQPSVMKSEYRSGDEVWYRYEVLYIPSVKASQTLSIYANTASTDIGGLLSDIRLYEDCEPTYCCPIPQPEVTYVNPCSEQLESIAIDNAKNRYDEYVKQEKIRFQQDYIKHCLDVYEEFFMKYKDSEDQTTLYYYDQAGNLVRTVPPNGIVKITNPGQLAKIKEDRANGLRTEYTQHTFKTTYAYNSLNQLVNQSTPDNETMPIWNEAVKNNGIPSNYTVTDVHFTDKLNGMLVANYNSNGHFYRTTDGGAHWFEINALGLPDLNSVATVNDHYWVVGNKGLVMHKLKGVDNSTWEVRDLPSAERLIKIILKDEAQIVNPASPNHIKYRLWMYSESGKAWLAECVVTDESNSALVSWTITGPYTDLAEQLSDKLEDVAFDANNIPGGPLAAHAVSADGYIYVSTDHGFTWNPSGLARYLDEDLDYLATTTDGTAFIGGANGLLMKGGIVSGTTTLPARWSIVPTNLSENIVKLWFYNQNNGFALAGNGNGNKILYRTTNGGKHFIAVKKAGGANLEVVDFHFANTLYGAAVTANGEVYYTDNGGLNWTQYGSTPITVSGNQKFTVDPAKFIRTVVQGNIKHILVSGNGVETYYSNNTGLWSALTTGTSGTQHNDIYMGMDGTSLCAYILNDARNVFAVRDINTTPTVSPSPFANNTDRMFITAIGAGVLLDNSNTVKTIKKITGTPGSSINLTGITYNANAIATNSSNSNIVLIGDNGEIHAVEGLTGSSVTPISVKNGVKLPGLKAVSNELGNIVAVGQSGYMVFGYQAGALQSRVKKAATSETLNDVKFASGTVTAVGNKHTLVTTTFTTTSTPTVGALTTTTPGTGDYQTVISTNRIGGANGYVHAISGGAFTVPTTANTILCGVNNMVAGQNGYLAFESSSTYSRMQTVTPDELNKLFFVNSRVVYAAGLGQRLWKSMDGGLTWSFINLAAQVSSGFVVNAIHFVNENTGFIAGTGGLLYKTVNGGTNFTLLTTASAQINDIEIHSSGYGYLVCSNGTCMQTTNGGNSWNTYSLTAAGYTSPNLRSVSVPDYNVAYISGDAGVMIKIDILQTTTPVKALKNGAQSWPQFLISAQRNLSKVVFVDRETGYVTGESGFMMKTTDGGINFRMEESGAGTNNLGAMALADATTVYTAGNNGMVTRILDMKDRFSSRFYYDALGRLVASQNAKQYNKKASGETDASRLYYSYTRFDYKGRIIEVGEIRATEPVENNYNAFGVMDELKFAAWVENGTRTEVTKTFYDVSPFADKINTALGFTQSNLRNRVAAAVYYSEYNNNPNTYAQASHYTYDIHGNVSTLLQENTLLADIGHAFKRLDYKYDLISGKVLEVAYQHESPDRFYHRYEYDGDNRIVAVKTSYDYVVWEQDANYKYYLHGPLARTELGNDQVQGLDYAYTLQGWLKTVNGSALDVNVIKTIGDDGLLGASNPNAYFAKDEMAFELKYYNGDYSAISTTANTKLASINSDYATDLQTRQMYNGNISGMITAHRQLMVMGKNPLATAYKYDQLNRLLEAEYYKNNTGTTWVKQADYFNRFTYDANGNISSQTRKGSLDSGLDLDDLSYIYYSGTNKLRGVNDAVSATAHQDDIDNQNIVTSSDFNYRYDELGNLIEDKAEEIKQILWNVSGKITNIIRNSGSTKPDLEFSYDAAGNRIMKTVWPKTGNQLPVRTFYVRDAQGNIMATYTREYRIDVNYSALTYQGVNNTLVSQGSSFAPFVDWLHTQNNNNNNNFITALSNEVLAMNGTQKTTLLNQSSAYAADLLTNISGLYDATLAAYTDNQVAQSAITYGDAANMVGGLCDCYAYQHNNVSSSIPDMATYFFNNTASRGNNSPRELFLKFLYNFNYIDPSAIFTLANNLGYTGAANYEDAADYLLAYNNQGNWTTEYNNVMDCSTLADIIQKAIQDGDPTEFSDLIGTMFGSLPDIRAMLLGETENCSVPYLSASQMQSALANRSDIMGTMAALGTYNNSMLTWLINNSTQFMLTTLATNNRDVVSAAQTVSSPYGSMEGYFNLIKTYYGENVYKNLRNQYVTSNPAYKDVLAIDERPIYGSSRLGSYQQVDDLFVSTFTATLTNGIFSNIVFTTTPYDMELPTSTYEISRGKKRYELSNHLGNVLAVISDKKLPQCEVQSKYDEPFTSTTGSWTTASGVSIVHESNRLKVTNTVGYAAVTSPSITGLTIGKRYVLTIDIERNTASVVNAYLKWGTSSSLYVRWMGAPGPVSYSIELVPQATSIKVELQGSGGIYYVDRVQVREADEEAGAYVSAKADVMQTNDYSPFGAPLANRNYKPIDEQNLQTLVSTTYDSGTDGWVSNGATLGNNAGRLQLLTYNAAAQSAQKTYTNLLTIGKKYRVSFDFIIDGITSASYTLSNGSTQVGYKVTTITTREVTEFTATATNLTLLATLSAGNYGRLAHIDNLVIEEIFEVGEGYRFGFNGMEKDDDTYGEGNAYDFGARIYDSRLGRWLSVDPLQEKYPDLSPYNFVANRPLISVDPDGKKIYFVNSTGELVEATKTMLRTVPGATIYKKYMGSDKEDIYIGVGDFGKKSAGLTVKNAQNPENPTGISVTENGSISIKRGVSEESQDAFLTAFSGVDFSQSKGKEIHLIAISNSSLKRNDKYEMAEAIYHEMKAHIEDGTGDPEKDHKQYGKTRVGLYDERVKRDPLGNEIPGEDGKPLKEVVPKNSPAGKMVGELKKLKEKQNGTQKKQNSTQKKSS